MEYVKNKNTNMNKNKIILSISAILFAIGFAGMASAASATLYVSPSSTTKNVGDIINASVGINTSGNKACVAEGTIVFNNLTCQSISIPDGVMAQTTPTCSNPHFIIGIPSCSSVNKQLLTVVAKANIAGSASINISSVDIIGEGVSIGSSATSGNYTVKGVTAPTNTPTSPTTSSTPKAVTQKVPTTSTETSPTPVNVEPEQPAVEQSDEANNQAQKELIESSQASASDFSNDAINQYVIWIIALIAIGIAIFAVSKRFKKE
jgi:hypothetical protein